MLSTAYVLGDLASLARPGAALPVGNLVMDAGGTLYGATFAGGANSIGTVFKLTKGSSAATTIASFGGSADQNPAAGVIRDSSGNLYGTTFAGGDNNLGTVFKVASGSNSITTIASFDDADGASPEGELVMDSSGNLYGTTFRGVTAGNELGTVFEIARGSSVIHTLASFDEDNGANPEAALILDSKGNLYGTTAFGGASDDGTVFEILKGSNAITTIASFDGADGSNPTAPLTFDASGNLFGTCATGGADNDGTVFEIPKGSSSIRTIATFTGANGSNPGAGLTFDANGNLFGTTYAGGASNDGTVFEIARGASTLTTLASFNGADGANPYKCALIVDSAGNLYGTAVTGGSADDGVIYELSPAMSFTLVNADTDRDIMPLTDGMTLDLSKLPRELNVRANTSGAVKSVQIALDGKSRLELQAPWALFGDWSGDYVGGTFADGAHTITARAFSGTSGTGTVGLTSTLHFNVINRAPAVTSGVSAMILFNTATGQTIRVLKDFDTLDLSQLPGTLGIRVTTYGTVGSVEYVVDADVGVPATNALTIGNHTLTVIPFSGPNASGSPGASEQLRLSIVRSLTGSEVKQSQLAS